MTPPMLPSDPVGYMRRLSRQLRRQGESVDAVQEPQAENLAEDQPPEDLSEVEEEVRDEDTGQEEEVSRHRTGPNMIRLPGMEL